ncbi:MAG: EamA family transporter [Pseudomonadota bacterium]|nr:EamA family transporter [Pseudomonadota bacterium]
MKKSILLAVDGSSGGGKALRHVLATIDPDTVGIVLAYVIEWSPYSFNTPEENAERHKRRESEISRAKAGVVAPAKAELEAKGFNVSALVRHGPPAETLIAAMQSALTALLAPLVLGERNSALQWAGIGVGFAGVVIFIGADSGVTGAAPWVYALPMLATASLTFITLWERRRTAGAGPSSKARPEMPIFTALFWQGVLTACLLLPFAHGIEGFAADWRAELVLAVVWLAVVSVGAYGLMFRLIRTRAATRVSALQYFVPPVTMLIAWPVFGEALTINGLAGLLVTSARFWLMARGAAKRG